MGIAYSCSDTSRNEELTWLGIDKDVTHDPEVCIVA